MRQLLISLFFFAFLFSYLSIPFFERFARKKGFVTTTNPDKIDKRSVPYLGGLAIYLSTLAVSFAGHLVFPGMISASVFYPFIFSASLIAFFGFLDDVYELGPFKKLTGQFIGAAVFVFFSLKTEIIFLNEPLNVILSLAWIIMMINAINLLDIMDGLAGSISFLNIFSLLVLAIITRNYFAMVIAAPVLGALFAFLRFNFPPARIFMGDTGSQFLGFLQGALAIAMSYSTTGREAGLFIPMIIFSVPLFDMGFVVYMRLRQKKSIFLKSNDHFVFRMLKLGVPVQKILKMMILISVFTNCCAFLISRVSNTIGLIIFLPVIAMLFFIGIKLSQLDLSK